MKWALGEKKRIEDDLKSKQAEVANKERAVEEARGKRFGLWTRADV